MKYLGSVPATKGVICELSYRDWEALLSISGVKEGDYLDEEERHPYYGREQREMLLSLAARAVGGCPPCEYTVAADGWLLLVAKKMQELMEEKWHYYIRRAS